MRADNSLNRRASGTRYEQKAAKYLERKGYCILEYNFRCRIGEIDLIARDGAYLVFIEVKYRSDASAGYGFEAVGYRKQRRIRKTALWYLAEKKMGTDVLCRFDVVSFHGDEITLIRDAF